MTASSRAVIPGEDARAADTRGRSWPGQQSLHRSGRQPVRGVLGIRGSYRGQRHTEGLARVGCPSGRGRLEAQVGGGVRGKVGEAGRLHRGGGTTFDDHRNPDNLSAGLSEGLNRGEHRPTRGGRVLDG